MYCKNCGTKNEKNSKYCFKCGTKLENDNKNLEFNKIPKVRKIIMGVVILIVIISLIILSILLNNPVKRVEDNLKNYYDNYKKGDITELIEIEKIINSSEEKSVDNIKDTIRKSISGYVKNFNKEYKNREDLDESYDKLKDILDNIYNYFINESNILSEDVYENYKNELEELYKSKVNYFYGLDYKGKNDYQTYYYYQKMSEKDCYYKKVVDFINDYISEELKTVLDTAKSKVDNIDKDNNEDMIKALMEEYEYLTLNKVSNNIDLSSNKDYQELVKEVLKEMVTYVKNLIDEGSNAPIDEILKLIDDEDNKYYQELVKLQDEKNDTEPEKLVLLNSTSYDKNISISTRKREINNKEYDSLIYFKTNIKESNIIYNLDKKYKKFKASIIGEDLDKDFKGKIIIYGDKKKIYQSEYITNTTNENIDLNIENIKELKIVLEISSETSSDARVYLVEPYLYK